MVRALVTLVSSRTIKRRIPLAVIAITGLLASLLAPSALASVGLDSSTEECSSVASQSAVGDDSAVGEDSAVDEDCSVGGDSSVANDSPVGEDSSVEEGADVFDPQAGTNISGFVLEPRVLDIEGWAYDGESGLDEVLVEIRRVDVSPNLFWDGSAFAESSAENFLPVSVRYGDDFFSEWFIPDVDLNALGDYEIRIRVSDNAGNVATFVEAISVAPDTLDPTGNCFCPDQLEAGVHTLQGYAEDPGSGVARVRVQVRMLGDTTLFWDGSAFVESSAGSFRTANISCLLYTSDAADE